ncbi:unnamed protein product [Brassica oleracea]
MERKIHVKVPHWVGMNIVEAAHRNEPTDEENDMLDLAFGLTEIIDISGFQIKEHALLFQLIHAFHHQHILRALELRLKDFDYELKQDYNNGGKQTPQT